MYKEIEISELIGSICIKQNTEFTITIDKVKSIMSDLRTYDRFISTKLTTHSIRRVNEILGDYAFVSSFFIPQSDKVRDEFIRDFYKVDLETRNLLTKAIHSYFDNE